MTDQMRKALERLLGAADGLIADMRGRAIMRGDYEIEDGKKIATLDCGNSVLFGIDGARVAAREALASAQPERVELTDAEIDRVWIRKVPEIEGVPLPRVRKFGRAVLAADRARRGGVEAEPAAKAIHYPTCWDTAAYPTIGDALAAVYHHFKCSECAPPAVPAEWREVMRAIADFEPIVMTSSSYGGSVFRVELGFRNLVDRNKGHDFLLKLIHFRDLPAGTKQSGGE